MPGCRLPRWHDAFTDIVEASNSKAVGIEVLCQHYGIERSETMAFGDGCNDIEMLQYCAIGVAMGNACRELLEIADHVTEDCDHDGVAEGIKTFCRGIDD